MFHTDEVIRFDNIIKEIKKEWNLYKQSLVEKYPAKEGEDWEFTCEHHKKIEGLLKCIE
tara:strand:- start:16946 stop:17122 length:177 start_codon:yes stop_codon:yes gene_type:complete